MLKQFPLVFFVLLGCYVGVNSHPQPLKHLSNELEVHAPASEVWEVYRNLGVLKLAAQKNIIQSLTVLKGDGGVGTVVKVTSLSGNESYTEKFTVINDQKRMKVAQGLKGDCLAIGCSVQIIQFDIIQKSQNSSIIKSDIAYAVKKGFEAKNPKPNIQFVEALAQLVKNFLENKNNA
ncbi:hypothetical protein HRI_003397900 [Hibiscus trionum]|uniref:Bet v I/Major latex protein domain-containing protein n=1 Tax=Hibiscus trionum TaxID=183268 RepID=A0A9W7ILH6_HIBTR|nr:hypothetical protein HRI_003397900 [Hibiscus trionum]